MHKTIENIIKKNLPEKVDDDGFAQDPSVAFNNGFDEALSQINPSKIADEVLKVVKNEMHQELNKYLCENLDLNNLGNEELRNDILQLLSNLSPNKENK